MSTPYQYAVRLDGRAAIRQPSKSIGEEIARAWVISPLRTASRRAEVVRRRGWDGEWATVATWTSPEEFIR